MNDNKQVADLFDRLFALPLLKWAEPLFSRHREGLLYLFFGVLTTAVSWGVFYLFSYPLSMNELLANLISWVAAVLFAFFTNRKWVFRTHGGGVIREMALFFGARLSTLVFEEILIFVFVTTLSQDAMAVKILGNIAVLILNYILSKLIVFRKKDKRKGA